MHHALDAKITFCGGNNESLASQLGRQHAATAICYVRSSAGAHPASRYDTGGGGNGAHRVLWCK
jgi:hypothetical protein